MDWISRLITDICELSDRNSPADQPDMMLVTGKELRDQIERRFEAEGLAVVEVIGEPMDPNFRPTREDLAALRIDANAEGVEGLPVKVNVAPAVVYMGWLNQQHDPKNPDSSPYRCVSFRLNPSP